MPPSHRRDVTELVQQKPAFSANEREAKLIGALREILAYHVQLVSKRKRRNDPEQSWTVKVARQAIEDYERG